MAKQNKTEKISVRLTKELLEAIDEYRNNEETKTRSEAILMLIETGLLK